MQDSQIIHWCFGYQSITSGNQALSHTYAAFGMYIVRLTFSDDDGFVGLETLQVVVLELPVKQHEVYIPMVIKSF